MFHCAAKFLTLLSVMFHAGFGCCAHHDHCSVLNSHAAAVERQEQQNDDPCSCRFHANCSAESKSEKSGEPEPGPCPCGESHEGCTDHCSWLTNSKVELPTNGGIVLPTAIAAVCSVRTSSAALIARIFADGSPLLSDSMDTLRAKSQVWRL